MMEEKQRLLRKYSDTLMICGIGQIVYGVWSFILSIMMLLTTDIKSMIEEMGNEDMSVAELYNFVFVFICVFIGLMLVLDMGSRLYIGLSARAESMGKPKGKAYIVLSCIVVLNYTVTLGLLYWDLHIEDADIITIIISIMIELTSMLIMIDLIRSAINIRKLRREISQEQPQEAPAVR
ncbi:MAG: hypothetical protein IKR73_05405 [Oscillospiraceae bacterium]|nr:hypothetical protein [Oscillospiraceae bacterium]